MEYSEDNCVCVTMTRKYNSQPWGFRMAGGIDLGCCLYIAKVNPRSLSERAGLRTGDVILGIEKLPANNLSHNHAKAEILRAGNDLHLIVKRGGIPMAEDPMAERRSVVVEERSEYRGDTNPTSQSRTFQLLNHFLQDELAAMTEMEPIKEEPKASNGPRPAGTEFTAVHGSEYASAMKPVGGTAAGPATTEPPKASQRPAATVEANPPATVKVSQGPVVTGKVNQGPVPAVSVTQGPAPIVKVSQGPAPTVKVSQGPAATIQAGPVAAVKVSQGPAATVQAGPAATVKVSQGPTATPPVKAPESMKAAVAAPTQASPSKLVKKPEAAAPPAPPKPADTAAEKAKPTAAADTSAKAQEQKPKDVPAVGSDVKSSKAASSEASPAEVQSNTSNKTPETEPVKAEAEPAKAKAEPAKVDAEPKKAEAKDASAAGAEKAQGDDSTDSAVVASADGEAIISVDLPAADEADANVSLAIPAADDADASVSLAIPAADDDAETSVSLALPPEDSSEANAPESTQEGAPLAIVAIENDEEVSDGPESDYTEGSASEEENEATFTFQLS